MKKLLSLPPNLVNCFHDITGYDRSRWFVSNDPVGKKLGSGGGSTWLLEQCFLSEISTNEASTVNIPAAVDQSSASETPTSAAAKPISGGVDDDKAFLGWLSKEKRLLLHAGGQSRRLPAYAPSGKILTPIPVARWERGQRLEQNLLQLDMPLFESIFSAAPKRLNTMIVSGDVYIRSTKPIGEVPDADVVCYGLWLSDDIATSHGVFVSRHSSPNTLKCMLQKPKETVLADLSREHYYLTDIGIWLLSDKAVDLLRKRSKRAGEITQYDLYSEFGCALGQEPTVRDEELNNLKVAVLPLPGGEFYHYGTTREIISSTFAVQNLVNDQREIMHHSRKPHPMMFVQNAVGGVSIGKENKNLWIENSFVPSTWHLAQDNVITGVPQNDWCVRLFAGACLDVVPIGESGYVVRPYGMDDKFRGALSLPTTLFLGVPFVSWASLRGVDVEAIEGNLDLQSARIFPYAEDIEEMGLLLRWMISRDLNDLSQDEAQKARQCWLHSRRLSADDISNEADLVRLERQRAAFRADSWQKIAQNYEHSVFYQLDLRDAAKQFHLYNLPLPQEIKPTAPLLTRIHDCMFRSEVLRLRGEDHKTYEQKAFSLLQEGLLEEAVVEKQSPRISVFNDQIVWGRSPVRIDIAGGWTDTPPYCLMEGGSVVNIAVELNGQPPLQAYIRKCKEPHIVLRSIDLGAMEVIRTFEELSCFRLVGSPFSIPKAALALSGFLPEYCQEQYSTLQEQLLALGSGLEVTLLSAIPAGSGLGTSSILASTVLGALNDFCSLSWDKAEIGRRTLALEQLLTTGGGWQDQYGGIFQGVKMLTTGKGFVQSPKVSFLANDIYGQTDYKACHLLYYTGITRTAKTILAEIVRRMFLNDNGELALLRSMKSHTKDMYDALLQVDFQKYGALVRKTWQQKRLIDSGTCPPAVEAVVRLVDDLCLGYELPGAGGGGYLYMVAKSPDAAARIRHILQTANLNPNARFVDMTLSEKGLCVSRS